MIIFLIPKENFKKVEEIRMIESDFDKSQQIREIKNEVPSFEEFMKTYENDGNVNYDDLNS